MQVVLQVVIAFIVEAFVVKIQAAQRRRTCTLHPNVYDCDCGKGDASSMIAGSMIAGSTIAGSTIAGSMIALVEKLQLLLYCTP